MKKIITTANAIILILSLAGIADATSLHANVTGYYGRYEKNHECPGGLDGSNDSLVCVEGIGSKLVFDSSKYLIIYENHEKKESEYGQFQMMGKLRWWGSQPLHSGNNDDYLSILLEAIIVKFPEKPFSGFGENPDSASGGAPVPEPATILLLGVGLIFLAQVGRKKIWDRMNPLCQGGTA